MNVTPYQQELNQLNKRINDLEKKLEKAILLVSDRVENTSAIVVRHDLVICDLKKVLKDY